MPHMQHPYPILLTPKQMVQRLCDFGVNYFGMGFNPWDFNRDVHNYQDIMDMMDEKVGYRLRPAMFWRRENDDKSQDIAIQLVNDGAGSVPGVLTIKVTYPDGTVVAQDLPAGAPFKGDPTLYTFRIPEQYKTANEKDKIKVTAEIQLRGKRYPVRWAVRQELFNDYEIVLPLREFVE